MLCQQAVSFLLSLIVLFANTITKLLWAAIESSGSTIFYTCCGIDNLSFSIIWFFNSWLITETNLSTMLAISKFAASSSRLKKQQAAAAASNGGVAGRLSPAAIRREVRQQQQQRLSHTGSSSPSFSSDPKSDLFLVFISIFVVYYLSS